MTTWNYRVIRKIAPISGETTYQIHEVYYREDGTIDCWTQLPVEPLGVSESQLRNDIHAFLAAFRQPVLEERQVRGKAVLIEEKTPVGTDLHRDYQGRVNRAAGYIFQMLGNHLLLKQDPALRSAYENVERALTGLLETALTPDKPPTSSRPTVSAH
jgi:hypothetical protein